MFNESDQVGVNYSDRALAEEYDSRHESFRDFHGEADRVHKTLNLSYDSIILDMGCGTGGIQHVELDTGRDAGASTFSYRQQD